MLDAFEIAALEHGVQGASFARIAAAGGFHRSLVQHHFGARAQLVDASLERVVVYYTDRLAEVGAGGSDRHLALVDWLLSPFGAEGPPRVARMVDAFVALASTDVSVGARLRVIYERFTQALADSLAAPYPSASPDARREVAFAIVCLSFGRAGLDTLGAPDARAGVARSQCDLLLASLAD